MTKSPFIEALTLPKKSVTAQPLANTLPQRHGESPPLLARLCRQTDTPVNGAQDHEDGSETQSNSERESALAARLCAALAELERVRVSQPAPIDVADLALTAARAVVNHELKTQRDVLRQHIDDACRTIEGEQSLRVRLHPELAETYLKGPRPDPFGLEVISDASLEPGGIIVEGNRSAADASVGTRLAQFKAALTFELERDKDAVQSAEEHVA